MQGNVTNNVQTFKVLSEVFGVILETVRELNIDYDIVPSVTWKSTLGIKGRTRPEQKRNAQQYVLDTYIQNDSFSFAAGYNHGFF